VRGKQRFTYTGTLNASAITCSTPSLFFRMSLFQNRSARPLLYGRRANPYPTPLPFSASPISSKIAGSSIVAGMVQGSWSAIFLIVPRRILPERVFGRRPAYSAASGT
jgi:hypothetical protein